MHERHENGWFAGLDPDDDAAAVDRRGRASRHAGGLATAGRRGRVADDEAAYYDRLHEVTMAATSAAVAEQEGADDQQLVHAVRAMADCERTANELAERVAEWGGSRHGDSGSGVEYARSLADREDEDEGDRALRSLAEQTAALADEADSIRAYIERTAPAVAPNLSMLAGPVLAARRFHWPAGSKRWRRSRAGRCKCSGPKTPCSPT